MNTTRKKANAGNAAPRKKPVSSWTLRLYVAGQTPKSLAAIANLKRICEEHLDQRYEIDIIDLVKHPHLASRDEIIAIPTLVRKLPEPVRRIIGDLSHTERVLLGFDLALPAESGHALRSAGKT